MRGFNLLIFGLVVIGAVIVIYIATNGGGIALGGYPGPKPPQQINLPQPHMP